MGRRTEDQKETNQTREKTVEPREKEPSREKASEMENSRQIGTRSPEETWRKKQQGRGAGQRDGGWGGEEEGRGERERQG